jgi:hypothetical protein
MKQFSVFSLVICYLFAGTIVIYSGPPQAAEWKVTGQDTEPSVSQVVPETTLQPSGYQATGENPPAVTSTETSVVDSNQGPGPSPEAKRWRFRDTELTVSVWESDGGTTWNHSSRALNSGFGDPTSRLDYRDISGTVVDLGLEVPLSSGFYVDLHYAHSSVDDGILVDDDYLSSQGAASLGIASAGDVLFSRTNSSVDEGSIQAFSVTAGREIFHFVDSPTTIRVYAKYQDYSESYHASGINQVVCAAPNLLCMPAGSSEFVGQRVISNKANWKSVYLGVDGSFNITPRLSISGDLAYSPWARVTNNDVHLLRGDLRPDPSIRIQTTGTGINASAEIAYRIGQWRASLGYQYWKLESRSDPNAISFFPSANLGEIDAHLNEITTRREGWKLGLSYLFGDGEPL